MADTGRPPIFSTPEEFKAVADAYFSDCEKSEKVVTVNGLCLALGMTRETLLRYAEKEAFSDTVNLVRVRLENEWEQRLASPNAAGTIFWLKNQGWTDIQRTELSGPNGEPVRHEAHVTLDPSEAYRRMLDAG